MNKTNINTMQVNNGGPQAVGELMFNQGGISSDTSLSNSYFPDTNTNAYVDNSLDYLIPKTGFKDSSKQSMSLGLAYVKNMTKLEVAAFMLGLSGLIVFVIGVFMGFAALLGIFLSIIGIKQSSKAKFIPAMTLSVAGLAFNLVYLLVIIITNSIIPH